MTRVLNADLLAQGIAPGDFLQSNPSAIVISRYNLKVRGNFVLRRTSPRSRADLLQTPQRGQPYVLEDLVSEQKCFEKGPDK